MFPERLTEGYHAFIGGRFARERSRYAMLAERGQRPEIMVIGCVDSRVSPEVIFDAAPGELLVVRNVAAIIPPYEEGRRYEDGSRSQHGTSAALEFGVQGLAVRHIVVLGHAHCGGVKFFAEDSAPLSKGDFISNWMAQIEPAAAKLGPHARYDMAAYERRLEFASVELSLVNLMTFPWVKDKVEAGKLELHGAYFGVAAGRLLLRDPATGRFEPVDDASPLPASNA